jgi:hypothetical protein
LIATIHGEQEMISSIIWLVLVHTGTINEQFAPWGIYLPVCLVEIVVYFKCLTSWGENRNERFRKIWSWQEIQKN